MVQSECNGNVKERVQYWEEWVKKASGRKMVCVRVHYRTGKEGVVSWRHPEQGG